MNKVILAGRLTKNPEIRYTQTGKAVASFTLAVNRRFSHNTNQEQTADFIPIVVWDKLAEVCSKYLFKGSQVLIEGRMQVRNYEAQDGSKRYVTEVIAQELVYGNKTYSRNYRK
jgi:single-strand DNA-binding protein